jgi:hypothetical protein
MNSAVSPWITPLKSSLILTRTSAGSPFVLGIWLIVNVAKSKNYVRKLNPSNARIWEIIHNIRMREWEWKKERTWERVCVCMYRWGHLFPEVRGCLMQWDWHTSHQFETVWIEVVWMWYIWEMELDYSFWTTQ